MYRYFIELAYKGTPFCGWQLQPNALTVQEELERVLRLLLREPVRLTGSGRTDTGVHASYFVAHFDSVRNDLHTDSRLVEKINRVAQREIAVYRITSVAAGAHARFDALRRTYHYRIATGKNPFTADMAYHLYRPLDVEKMNEAAKILPEYTDFTSFSKLHGNAATNLCRIEQAYWTDEPEIRELCFVITANRFLRNMVRAIAGTMIEIGYGKRLPGDIRRIIEARDRNAAGTSVPPQGLYLTDIAYPPDVFQSSVFPSEAAGTHPPFPRNMSSQVIVCK
ncbi:MAG: tRNA pseudouridine(38-40) synthase TruA [Bacteroidales bacterium]|nr:tRNA pseudouridine(38-40) synthase TruA [Bacteroidales bacterium]